MLNNLTQNTTCVQTVSYAYNGNPVKFNIGSNVMVNATHMARNFPKHKQPNFWLNNQQTQDFLSELSKLRILSLADLVQVKRGGANPGTWMHEDVAIEFARWLSPAFAIWCNDRIKEILLGKTSKEIKGSIPAVKKFQQAGNGMSPKIPSGAIIDAIEINWRQYINLNGIYILELNDGRLITKEIISNEKEKLVLKTSIFDSSKETIDKTFINTIYLITKVYINY